MGTVHDTEGVGGILVADPCDEARGEFQRILRAIGYEPLAVESGEQALEAAREARPHLVISEVDLPGVCGYEVCRRLRERHHDEVAFMFVSGTRTESFDHVAGILIGADDYLDKPVAADELIARVERLMRRAGQAAGASLLTPRELEVLDLLEDGLRYRQIAEHLSISPKTVGTHVEHIFSKLGARHRRHAVALARRGQA